MNKRTITLAAFAFLVILTLVLVDHNQETQDTQIDVPDTLQVETIDFWVGDTTEYIHGIDVSHHQDTINWDKVKEYGVTFVFVKATEGIDYLDTMFTFNWANVDNENMIRGAYHFYESDDDPVVQAKWFVDHVKNFEAVLPPVIDVERAGHEKVTVEEYQNKLKVHLKEVERLTGQQPIIYSSPNFATKYLSDDVFGNYKLWIAEYGVEQPKIPDPWQNQGWNFWQDSFRAKVPGVPKQVDRNRFVGKFSDLVAMIE